MGVDGCGQLAIRARRLEEVIVKAGKDARVEVVSQTQSSQDAFILTWPPCESSSSTILRSDVNESV